jgi:hypothetical protein
MQMQLLLQRHDAGRQPFRHGAPGGGQPRPAPAQGRGPDGARTGIGDAARR